MKTNPYQVLGASVASMLGRAALVQRLDSHLQKTTPDHLSMVGPAHYGKTVLLQHLSGTYRTESSHYMTAVYVDLRHRIPASDREFMQRFAEEIRAALEPVHGEFAEWIESDDESVHEVLGLVFDELAKSDERLLVVFDGFDYALAGSGLTRNLWDQLRALAQKSSLRLVTGSRRPLRELCNTEETRTSDFWEIFFDTPVRVTALVDTDVETFLQPLRDEGCEFDESAQKEVSNWTGRVPVLLCALLHELWEEHRGARLSKPSVDAVAGKVLAERQQLLAALWDDCDDELQADLGMLSKGDIPLTELSEKRRDALEERGFGHVSGSRMRGSCRLMQRYAGKQAPAVAQLTRLMGTTSGFDAHVRSLLELRLAQVSAKGVDDDLRGYVGNAIRDLSPAPERALIWVRGIANRALKLIWAAEIPPDRTLPAAWLEEWRYADVNYTHDEGRLPRSPGAQCGLLRLATGTERTIRQTSYVTRTTYLQLDYLQSVGDFGQHRDEYAGTEVAVGFAASVVFTAISLLECLTQDLSGVDTI